MRARSWLDAHIVAPVFLTFYVISSSRLTSKHTHSSAFCHFANIKKKRTFKCLLSLSDAPSQKMPGSILTRKAESWRPR